MTPRTPLGILVPRSHSNVEVDVLVLDVLETLFLEPAGHIIGAIGAGVGAGGQEGSRSQPTCRSLAGPCIVPVTFGRSCRREESLHDVVV